MANILVTGSNGFIGRNVVAALRAGNIGNASNTSNTADVIYGCGRSAFSNSECDEYFMWNLARDEPPSDMKQLKFNIIIHAAASLAKDNLSDSLISSNCYGTFNILKLATNVKNIDTSIIIIYISSLPIIGDKHLIPINENIELNPPTMYHATKAAGELIISQAVHFGIRAISLRVPSPIGPGMPINTIVPIFIKRALSNEPIMLQGKGTRKQNYLDVRDLAEAVKRLVSMPPDWKNEENNVNSVFNIGAKNIISNLGLAKTCIDILKSKSEILYSGIDDPNDNVDWTTDDSRLRTLIGEYQSHDIAESILDIARAIG